MHFEHLNSELKRYFGFTSFKGHQKEIIKNLLDGKNSFVIMPTGAGKSLCYQLPSLLLGWCFNCSFTSDSFDEKSS